MINTTCPASRSTGTRAYDLTHDGHKHCAETEVACGWWYCKTDRAVIDLKTGRYFISAVK